MKADKEKLQIAMANACMTAKELSEKASIPRPTLNGVVSGKSARPVTIGRIARALGVTVEDILAKKEETR